MDHDFCQEIDLIFPNICPWFLVFCFFFLFWSFKLSNIFVGFLSVLTLGMWCRIQHLHSSLQIETPGCHSDFVTNCDNICIFLLKAKLPPELFSELYHPHCYQEPTSITACPTISLIELLSFSVILLPLENSLLLGKTETLLKIKYWVFWP